MSAEEVEGEEGTISMLEMYRQALLKRGISAISLDSQEDSQVAKDSDPKRRPPLISELPFFPKWASASNADDAGQPDTDLVAEQRNARRTAEKVPWHPDYGLMQACRVRFWTGLILAEVQLEKKLAGRGRGRGCGRGRGLDKDAPGKRGRGRGRGSKTLPESKPKVKAKKAAKSQPSQKVKAKSGSEGEVLATAPKKGKGKGQKKKCAESNLPGPSQEPPATPLRPGKNASQASPAVHSGGKFVLSARRRGQQKRKETARKALMMLREANLVGLELPKSGFDRQSYTVNPGPDMEGHSSIGVVLKSKTFYIADAGKIPPDLAPYAHCDEKLGCTIGFGSYPSLEIALL